MRKTLMIGIVAAAALAIAAAAMAAVFTASGVTATTATFSTDKVTKIKSRSCTGADTKAFTVTDGRYTGVADFTNPAVDLDGPLTIHAKTTYSTTDAFGWVEGSFRIKDDPTRLNGKFSGTLKGTAFVGFLSASSRGHHARVLGNLSATFNPATGFTGGLIGSGSSTAVLAVIAGPVCKAPKPAPKPKPVRPVHVHGDVTGLVTTMITVTPKHGPAKACAIDASSPPTAAFPVGTKNVEMECKWVGTPTAVLTLSKLRAHH